MIYGSCVGGVGLERTYILEDEAGNELPATMIENDVVFDATPNDIRTGKIAVNEQGVIVGEKNIPAYHTTEGKRKILAGESVEIPMYSDQCQFTKFQALICAFNTTLDDSVSTEKVSIDSNVYEVNSNVVLASVTVDAAHQTIKLGIVNESENPVVLRFFTYKEEI